MEKLLRNVCALILTTAMMLGIMQGPLTWAFANGNSTQTVESKDMVQNKMIDDITVPQGELHPGDSFYMSLDYHINANTYGQNGNQNAKYEMTYSLPAGISTKAQEDREFTDNKGKVLGTYSITADGKMVVKFNDQFDIHTTYTGSMNFSCQVNKDVTQSIKFDGANATVKIKDNNSGNTNPSGDGGGTDSTVKKEILSHDSNSILYKVSISTKNGTGIAEKIDDSINKAENVTAKYDRNSFKLIKKKADGSTVEVKFNADQLSITDNGDDKQKFTLNNLTKLEAGESYELTYKVNIKEKDDSNGETKVGNYAQDGLYRGGYIEINPSKKMISKSGKQILDRIKWNVEVNEAQQDISNFHLIDNLPENYHLVDNIVVQDEDSGYRRVNVLEAQKEDANKSGTKKVDIDFSKVPSDKKQHKFSITFWTNTVESDIPGKVETVKNEADFIGNEHTYKGTAKVSYQPFGVNKSSDDGKNTITGNQRTNHWNVNVKFSGYHIDQFTYKDVIGNAKDENGNDKGADTHYAIAATLFDEIGKSIDLKRYTDNNYGSDSKEYTKKYVASEPNKINGDYQWILTCYDANGKQVDNTDKTTHVKSYTLQIKTNNDDVKPSDLDISYTTIGDISQMKEGESWKFNNTGKFDSYNNTKNDTNHPSRVNDNEQSSSYKNERLIQKLSSIDPPIKKDDPNSYQIHDFKESLNADYSKMSTDPNGNKILYYCILLTVKPDYKETGDTTVTDVMPKGMTYVEGSMIGHFYGNDWWLLDSNGKYTFKDNEPTVSASKEENGDTKLTIKIKKGFTNGQKQIIVLNYKTTVSIEDWLDMNVEHKTYRNTASWDGAQTTQNTTVNREVKNINKTGVQLTDSKGNPLNKISYNVPINPAAKDLNVHGDTLTLVDKLTAPGGVSAYLDLNSVKLSKYDESKPNAVGEKVDSSLYSFTYDEKTHEMSLEIPDSMGLVLTYNYSFDPGSYPANNNGSGPNISNEVELGGRDKIPFNSILQQGQISIVSQDLTIKKVDSKDYSKSLESATFSAYQLINNKWEEVKLKSDTTDENGEIKIQSLAVKTLYKIEEKSPPKNYSKNPKVYYAYVTDNKSLADNDKEKIFNSFDSSIQNAIGSKDNITFVGKQGAMIVVPDDYTKLTVDKTWVAPDGTATKPGAQKVTAHLYKYIKTKPSVDVTFRFWHGSNQPETEILTIAKGTAITVTLPTWANTDTFKDKDNHDYGKAYTTPVLDQDTQIDLYTGVWKDSYSFNYTKPQYQIDKTHRSEEDTVATVELNPKNNWKYTWNDLPSKDNDGNEICYAVTEDDVPGYKTTYRNNNGINAGNIHIINTADKKKDEQYTLPSTGGKGTTMFYAAGLLLISLAVILFIKRYKHLNERG